MQDLGGPYSQRIEAHVQNIIEQIFVDGQLDECELTFKDLHAIQKSFITILIGIFHQRIGVSRRGLRMTVLIRNTQDSLKLDLRRLRSITEDLLAYLGLEDRGPQHPIHQQ